MTIPAAQLHEWFSYDPTTGLFIWRKRPERGGMNCRVGDEAGSVHTTRSGKRLMLWLKGQRMYASRAAYIYMHGDIPQTALVDHINGDTLDDRIENLRLASSAQNNWNRIQREGSRYKLGVAKGIRGRFTAQIQMPNGEKLHLGTWETEAEAHACYMGAAAVLHGEFWVALRDADFQKRAAEAY